MSDVSTPRGNVKQIEHWNGSMDATVRPKSFGVKLARHTDGAPVTREYATALSEYETAVRGMEHAQLVADPHWIRKAETRLRVAKEKLQTIL